MPIRGIISTLMKRSNSTAAFVPPSKQKGHSLCLMMNDSRAAFSSLAWISESLMIHSRFGLHTWQVTLPITRYVCIAARNYTLVVHSRVMKVEREKFENAMRKLIAAKPLPKKKVKTAKIRPRQVIEPAPQR